jgi:hypothetical protein
MDGMRALVAILKIFEGGGENKQAKTRRINEALINRVV